MFGLGESLLPRLHPEATRKKETWEVRSWGKVNLKRPKLSAQRLGMLKEKGEWETLTKKTGEKRDGNPNPHPKD